MSRIGKLPIIIPDNVDINWSGSEITVKGKFGTLQTHIPETIGIQQDESILKVSLKSEARNLRSLHGLYRTLINNMVIGVSEQFQVTLLFSHVALFYLLSLFVLLALDCLQHLNLYKD